ncbi:DUF349 domain-containing protein [Phycicoccus sp.]|uniref:DUF349 domain-containing protein n=1 Tax=Phycicoccus sp. TaxID=1902410 RepID=UPI002B9C65C1|nr:DUF349 domain-containing protein [Phycicoccus sp.]HMM94761.1 DUF349 domain-containing protein [Phycicoccus sp.]
MSEDQPVPRPPVPSPAALARRVAARPVAPPVAPAPHSDSARFGRVDESGHVFVTVGDEEREVGAYPGASPEEALQYFARKYDELAASAELLEARLANPDVSAKEVADGLATLKEHVEQAHVVGDLAALHGTVERVEGGLEAKRAAEAEHRRVARAEAATAREAIVAEAESIAAQPAGSTQWKQSGERMRALLEDWKQHQRSAAKLDKPTETALWQRFSHARNTFDKARRAWFAELESTRADAKATKESLVAEAEALATSTDWAPTARAYKQLMDRWRQAGRASRHDDDALWERFRAAQDAFFTAKDTAAAVEDEEFRGNLAVKEELLVEAEALLPVTDVEAAKTALRGVQERWEAAGKVPRGDLERVEKRLRRVETAVREADEKKWRSTNPELSARAQSMVDQLEASVAKAEAEVAKAETAGDATKAAAARERLAAQQQWLDQARAGLDEFGG